MRVDPQVDPLIDKVRDLSDDIVRLLAQLPFADSTEKFRIMAQIREILELVEEDVRAWAERELAAVAEEHDEDMLLLLPFLVGARGLDELIERIYNDLTAAVRKTTRSVQVYAHTLASPSTASRAVRGAIDKRTPVELQGISAIEKRKLTEKLQTALNKHFVRVLGKDGKIYTYAMDYWVAMQAQMSRAFLRREITLLRTLEGGYDLVQISNNFSTVGDFCDLYRGKVFSISGTHPFYPPLSSCPNGGTPFHPWCRHWMIPFTSNEEVEGFAGIPQDFLDLGNDPEASINDFQNLWIGDDAE